MIIKTINNVNITKKKTSYSKNSHRIIYHKQFQEVIYSILILITELQNNCNNVIYCCNRERITYNKIIYILYTTYYATFI